MQCVNQYKKIMCGLASWYLYNDWQSFLVCWYTINSHNIDFLFVPLCTFFGSTCIYGWCARVSLALSLFFFFLFQFWFQVRPFKFGPNLYPYQEILSNQMGTQLPINSQLIIQLHWLPSVESLRVCVQCFFQGDKSAFSTPGPDIVGLICMAFISWAFLTLNSKIFYPPRLICL